MQVFWARMSNSPSEFIKNPIRSRLSNKHLNCALRMKVQQFFTLTNFPYKEVYEEWKSTKERRILT